MSKYIFMFMFFFLVFANAENNSTDALTVGLTDEQWHFQIALLANFLGFTTLFLVCFIAVLVVRR